MRSQPSTAWSTTSRRRRRERLSGSEMQFLVTLEKDEDGYIVAECPSLPGCLSQGKTRDEALANIKDAIRVGVMW